MRIFLLILFAIIPFGIERNIHGLWVTSNDILIVLGVLSWITVSRFKIRIEKNYLLYFFLILIGTFLISLTPSQIYKSSIKEISKYFLIISLIYLSINNLNKDELVQKFPIFITISAVITGLWYIKDILYIGPQILSQKVWIRENLNTLHINLLGSFFCITIPFCFYLMFISKKIQYFILSLTSLIIQFIAVILTYSRGAWITITICTAFLMIYKYKIKGVLYIFFILVLPFIITSIYFPKFQFYERLLSTFNAQETSISSRKLFIDTAIDLFKKYPITGVGLGNFKNAAMQEMKVDVDDMVHNMFLQFAVETGIVSFIIIIAIIVMFFIETYKLLITISDYRLRLFLLVNCISFAGLIISSQFGDPFVRYLKEYFAITFAIPYAIKNKA